MPGRWYLVARDGICPECGYEAVDHEVVEIGDAIVGEALGWRSLLDSRSGDPALVARPAGSAWSPLEYGGHVRDVLVLFAERVRRTLTSDQPKFEYHDQDAAVVVGRYNEADPRGLAEEIMMEAQEFRELLDGLSSDDWFRWGTRKDDERFDVALLARFTHHEVRHHRLDAERLLQE